MARPTAGTDLICSKSFDHIPQLLADCDDYVNIHDIKSMVEQHELPVNKIEPVMNDIQINLNRSPVTKMGLRTTFDAELSQTSVTLSHLRDESVQLSKSVILASMQPEDTMVPTDPFCTTSLDHASLVLPGHGDHVRNMASLAEPQKPQVTTDEALTEQKSSNLFLEKLPNQKSAKMGTTKKTQQTVNKIMDFGLLLDAVLILFAVSNLLTGFAYVVPLIFLPSRGVHLGFDSHQSSWLMSVFGIVNTIGRLTMGFISNLKSTKRLLLHIYNAVIIILGVSSLMSVFLRTYPLQMCYSAVVGFFMGTN